MQVSPEFALRAREAASFRRVLDGGCPQGEGMLHDARNLVGTIGLYCDLLAMPGVLKPEHSKYAEELRHLGARSGALIDALMRSLLMRERSKELCPAVRAKAAENDSTGQPEPEEVEEPLDATSVVKAVSLRGIVERCSGLLRRVANGRVLELEFGPAAAAPVKGSRGGGGAHSGEPGEKRDRGDGSVRAGQESGRQFWRRDSHHARHAGQPGGRGKAMAVPAGEVVSGGFGLRNVFSAGGLAAERQSSIYGQSRDRLSRSAGTGRSVGRRSPGDE